MSGDDENATKKGSDLIDYQLTIGVGDKETRWSVTAHLGRRRWVVDDDNREAIRHKRAEVTLQQRVQRRRWHDRQSLFYPVSLCSAKADESTQSEAFQPESALDPPPLLLTNGAENALIAAKLKHFSVWLSSARQILSDQRFPPFWLPSSRDHNFVWVLTVLVQIKVVKLDMSHPRKMVSNSFLEQLELTKKLSKYALLHTVLYVFLFENFF